MEYGPTSGMEKHLNVKIKSQAVCRLVLIVCLCLLHGTSGQMGSAPLHVATFSMNGASGTVSFREQIPEPVVSISIDLFGLAPGNYTWAIHEKPMVYGQQPPCDPAIVGGVYAHGGDLTAAHNVREVPSSGSWSANFIDQEITLSGPKCITGRTLVLQEESSQRKYCARIANSRAVVTAVARFDEPFAGTVTFRQERNQPQSQSQTSIFIDLYDVTDPIAQTKYAWRVSSNSGYNNDMDHEALCDKTSSDVYNPTGLKTVTCGREDLMSCPIGYLVGKFDDVTVEPIPSLMTYYFIDTNLPLSGEHSVIGKSLVFSDAAGNPVVCSPIIELKSKSVKALFSVNGVSGTAVFSQDSPYDITEIKIDLKNLRGLAGGYHIHVLPPPPRTYASDQPASPQNVAGHYNPYDVGPSPPAGTGTNDQYEVGDLSGKFGLLMGHNDFNETYYDWNLPLFGKNSIVGRSLVIHKMEGDRWVYAAVGYPTQQKTVKAVFKSPAVGKIVMRQDIDDPYADTSIYIEMAFADGSATTTDHNWHVHTLAAGNDHIASNGRCVSCAGHFNPFGVELGESYDYCSPAFQQRCELGDLSKKHGRLTITNKMNLGMGKFFFTDTWLPLSGVHSVTGRSIVIHAADEGSARMSCADLLQIPPTESTAVLWSDGPVSGDITFKQDSDFDPVLIHIHVTGLNNIAGGWHVHVLPIDKDMSSAPCSPVSVLGHYNPFRIVGSPPNGTLDMYEMGDLSGKFETFSGLPDFMDHVYKDTNLALAGPRSIIGRSLVIHKSADGSRWVCASIERKTHEDDFIIRARADITTTDFTGYVILSQTRYHTGALGDTTVEIGLFSNVAQTDIFLWGFRQGRIVTECLASTLSFNPHQIDIETDYDNQCDTKNHIRCAVGDLTGKHGNISGTVKRAVYTDVNLPLFDQASVLGLYFHLTSTNTGQLACSTLQPDSNSGRVEYLSYPSTTSFDSYKFRQLMEDSMVSLEMWQVVTEHEPVINQSTGCSSLKFYLIGSNVDEMHQEFKMVQKTGNLGEYSPTTLCDVDDDSGGYAMTPGKAPVVTAVLANFVLVLLQWYL